MVWVAHGPMGDGHGGWALGGGRLSSLRVFWGPDMGAGGRITQKTLRKLVRQLLYTMFMSNNHPSFHLW